jgi:hypothetical protein
MIKRKPSEWEELIGIEVIDTDGWAWGTWETPITAGEFIERCDESTVRYFTVEKARGLDIGILNFRMNVS